jgi:hypothetical protein
MKPLSIKLNQKIKQITNGQEVTLKIQNPMAVLMMMSLLLQARNNNQVLNLQSQLVMRKVTMTMRTMIIKIMMMTLMKMKNMMVIMLTRMTMIKYDKNESE